MSGSAGRPRKLRHVTRAIGAAIEALGHVDTFVDELCGEHGFERAETVVGGFSQGAGLAAGLCLQVAEKARPAGCLSWCGYLPAVPGFDIDWEAAQEVSFQILSDGFDYNLDRLQERFGVRFDYHANHLRVVDGRWQIAPGGRNPECGCGTGSCKRARIGAYREANPGRFCVHIGNGRVSDLCGALAADQAFAKETLAEALDAQNAPYTPFETLHDVVAVLEERFGKRAAPRA